MMKKSKNKGITLVALIITIIVMLILVGVTVQILINSGLIGTAENAGDRTQSAYEEEANLGEFEIAGNKYANVEDYLNNNPMSPIRIKLTMSDATTEVTADGTIVKEIKEEAPIPAGFYYVGGTKNTGIVISDNSADANKGADAELQGNQFVWVPVVQNQTLKIEVNTESDITGIKIEDPLYREITTDKNGQALAPSGTSYTAEVNPTINGIYTITVAAGEETNIQTLRVTSLYAQDFFADYQLTPEYAQFKGYDTLQEYLIGEYGEGATIESALRDDAEINSAYTDDTIETYASSVNTYGGFYIARYEAGTDTARTYGNEADISATVYSKKNMYPYNLISQTDAITKSSTMYNKTNVTTALTNAAAWDRTINWLVETNAITTNEVVDSTNFGNYSNSTFDFTGKYYYKNSGTWTWANASTSTSKPVDTHYLLGTGVSSYTKSNNIYDLAGNCFEWTTEANPTAYGGVGVIMRGGYWNVNTVSFRTGNTTFWDSGVSFRPSLYISVN